MDAVCAENLTKQYRNNRGLINASFHIEPGEVFGLLGPNGSGKTTIMKLMTGLVFPDRGTIRIFGNDPFEDRVKALEPVGCMLEQIGFYPYLTAAQNLQIVRRIYPECSEARVEHLLIELGLYQYKEEKVKYFSLGMRKRLGIAMAFLSDPQLLVLDEPFNALDIEGMMQLKEVIRRQQKKGKTIMLSSHLVAEVEQLCSRVAVIDRGEVLNIANVLEAIDHYGNLETYYLSVIKANRQEAL